MLNDLLLELDRVAVECDCRPIESVRGEWLVACGAPEPNPEHVARILSLATAVRRQCRLLTTVTGVEHSFKMGIQCGPVTVGPLGCALWWWLASPS